MKISDLKGQRIYLATPYSRYPAGIHAAWREACRLAAEFVRDGVRVYCPIAHTHGIALHGNIDPYSADWYIFDEPEINLSDTLVVAKMSGWEESIGIRQEVRSAICWILPIYYLDPQTLVVELASGEWIDELRKDVVV